MAGYTVGFPGEDLDGGLLSARRALDLNANPALANANAGRLSAYRGRADEAGSRCESARSPSPRDPDF